MNASDFPMLGAGWNPLPHEIERRRRIQVSVATYAYEIVDKPIMPDRVWDSLAQRINKTRGTGHPLLDEFFATEFSPMTGMWIHHHPELAGIERIYSRYWDLTRNHYEALYRRKKL